MENQKNIRYDFSTASSTTPTETRTDTRILVARFFDKLINKGGGHNNALPTLECQGAIRQLGSFITQWQADPGSTNFSAWLMLPPMRYDLHKNFPMDLYRNVVTACGIDKGFGWIGKTHNLRCSDQLQSLKESVDTLMASSAAMIFRNPGYPIDQAKVEKDCRDYGLCEFQVEGTRYAVMESYSKIKTACNMN
jgi:hypothetical protein